MKKNKPNPKAAKLAFLARNGVHPYDRLLRKFSARRGRGGMSSHDEDTATENVPTPTEAPSAFRSFRLPKQGPYSREDIGQRYTCYDHCHFEPMTDDTSGPIIPVRLRQCINEQGDIATPYLKVFLQTIFPLTYTGKFIYVPHVEAYSPLQVPGSFSNIVLVNPLSFANAPSAQDDLHELWAAVCASSGVSYSTQRRKDVGPVTPPRRISAEERYKLHCATLLAAGERPRSVAVSQKPNTPPPKIFNCKVEIIGLMYGPATSSNPFPLDHVTTRLIDFDLPDGYSGPQIEKGCRVTIQTKMPHSRLEKLRKNGTLLTIPSVTIGVTTANSGALHLIDERGPSYFDGSPQSVFTDAVYAAVGLPPPTPAEHRRNLQRPKEPSLLRPPPPQLDSGQFVLYGCKLEKTGAHFLGADLYGRKKRFVIARLLTCEQTYPNIIIAPSERIYIRSDDFNSFQRDGDSRISEALVIQYKKIGPEWHYVGIPARNFGLSPIPPSQNDYIMDAVHDFCAGGTPVNDDKDPQPT